MIIDYNRIAGGMFESSQTCKTFLDGRQDQNQGFAIEDVFIGCNVLLIICLARCCSWKSLVDVHRRPDQQADGRLERQFQRGPCACQVSRNRLFQLSFVSAF